MAEQREENSGGKGSGGEVDEKYEKRTGKNKTALRKGEEACARTQSEEI